MERSNDEAVAGERGRPRVDGGCCGGANHGRDNDDAYNGAATAPGRVGELFGKHPGRRHHGAAQELSRQIASSCSLSEGRLTSSCQFRDALGIEDLREAGATDERLHC